MNSRSVKTTVHLCGHRGDDGHLCGKTAGWCVQNQDERTVKVCDAHLAWALRASGLPARVDNLPPVA